MPNNRAAGKRRSSIQSIDRATAILKALASGPRRLGVSELAERLGLARPTVHGLLQTLQSHGFVEQDSYSDKYQLGPGLLQLGYSYLDLNELRARSIAHADHLASRTGAAVRVGVMHGSSVVVVHHVFRPDAAFGVVDSTDRIMARGLLRGIGAAVSEAARGVSRELGAARWPYAAEA